MKAVSNCNNKQSNSVLTLPLLPPTPPSPSLPPFARPSGLEEGDVVEIKLIRDKHTGFPAGYGFVEFSSLEIAEKVLETCNGNAIGR